MIKSYAKINLFLRVLKKIKGLHNVQSSIMLLDLFDSISVKRIKKKKTILNLLANFKKI